jgi:dihydroorotate dehydrogenase electron transfer subunit
MFELQAPLVGRRQVGRDMWVLGFEAASVAATVRSGQFVNLGLQRGQLLRRPFSVYQVEGDVIEIVLKAVGWGTELLLALRPEETVSCLGPLGRGFQFDGLSSRVVLLSGGLGVAPMPLAARDARDRGLGVVWVHGARTAADLCTEWQGEDVHWATEDGSQGLGGSALAAVPSGAGAVLACGPNAMLAAVAGRWPDAQVALETYMGCGTGVCLGCAVPLAGGGYDRACSEGPVYRAADVDWQAVPSHLHYRATA